MRLTRKLKRKARRYLISIVVLLILGILSKENFEQIIESAGETTNLTAQSVIDIESSDTSIESNDNQTEFQEASLVRVVDGDTLVVEIEGTDYKVRLIGVNTPESVAPESYQVENTEEGVLASDYVKTLLENTTTLYLEKDVSDTDKYDRLLRYVWLEIPEDSENINEISTKMLNGILLLDKVAEVATYEPDVKYVEQFEYISTTM